MYEFSADSYLKPQQNFVPSRKGEIAESMLGRMRDGYATGAMIELEDKLDHYHPAGLYGRRQYLKKDTYVVGKVHKRESITIVMKGTLAIVDEHGNRELHSAPDVWITPVGRQRVIYAVTDAEWIGVWPTEKTELQEIEDELACMSMEEFERLALEN